MDWVYQGRATASGYFRVKVMKSFGLSCEDAQGKNIWRLRIQFNIRLFMSYVRMHTTQQSNNKKFRSGSPELWSSLLCQIELRSNQKKLVQESVTHD